MRVGSLARTIAHELEYNFSLTHPGKSEVSTLGRLMGGRKQDYALTEEDVTKARKVAQERSELERNSTFRGKNGSPGHLVGCVRMSIDFKAARNPVRDCLEVGEISVSPCAAACELQ